MTGNKLTFADWYQAVVRDADMAESSPVRGAMVTALGLWGMGTDPAGTGPPHQGHQS
jgi:prolyl-tRNA synthetase